MTSFTDQLGRVLNLGSRPQRIISLVPSQTELLFDLGLGEEVVGITKFCVHPEKWFRSKFRVGGTKQLNLDTIHSLKPDLVIANKEENVREQVEEIAAHYPVWISDVHDLDSAYDMIKRVGELVGKKEKAEELVREIAVQFSILDHEVLLPASYLIWKDPYMSVGGDTFISCMMEKAGFRNVTMSLSRYPIIDPCHPDSYREPIAYCLLSTEPYPFKQSHADELERKCPGIRFILVDGEMFSWYGSRLLKAPGYFKKLRKMIDDN